MIKSEREYPMDDDGLYSNYRLTVRMELKNVPGTLASITNLLAREKVNIGAVDIVEATSDKIIRDVTFDAKSEDHGQQVVQSLNRLADVRVISVSDRIL